MDIIHHISYTSSHSDGE